MKKKYTWLMAAVMAALSLFSLTAYGDSGSSVTPAESIAAVNPVSVPCENGVMLGQNNIVPAEYAHDEKVKAALAKSGFVSETWRYEILDFADKFADADGDIRVYLWTVPSIREDMYKSAVHAVELAYVFNNEDSLYAGEVDPETAAKVQESWTNFAKTGDPSIDGAVWKPYNTGTRDTMVIGKEKWECISDPSKTARELLEKAYGDEPYHIW